jgi:hypothetical protein
MKNHLVIVSLLFVALAAPAALRADQQYNVNMTVGSDTVTGTIDTDGNLGTLNTVDINSFQFGVSNAGSSGESAGSTAKESGSVADIDLTGDGVTATSAGLFFNFNTTDPSSLQFLNAQDNFLLCLFTDEGCDPPGSGEVLTLGSDTFSLTNLSGNQMFASSATATAPEPGTLGFMLIGMVGVIFVLRKRPTQPLQPSAGTER